MKMKLWHPDTAMRIEIERNFLQRFFYPKDFATLGEVLKHYRHKNRKPKEHFYLNF